MVCNQGQVSRITVDAWVWPTAWCIAILQPSSQCARALSDALCNHCSLCCAGVTAPRGCVLVKPRAAVASRPTIARKLDARHLVTVCASEDQRSDLVFPAWIPLLTNVTAQLATASFTQRVRSGRAWVGTGRWRLRWGSLTAPVCTDEAPGGDQ